jgi:hypothetical protein
MGRRVTKEGTVITKKRGIVIVMVAAVAAVGLAAGTAWTAGQAPWKTALDSRSAGLDQRYVLDVTEERSLGSAGPAWGNALMIRSEAMNRKYHLGEYAPHQTTAVKIPDWMKALAVRSEALDRKYKLGRYAGK